MYWKLKGSRAPMEYYVPEMAGRTHQTDAFRRFVGDIEGLATIKSLGSNRRKDAFENRSFDPYRTIEEHPVVP